MTGYSTRGGVRFAVLAAAALALAGCGTTHREEGFPIVSANGGYKIGNPYTVNGVTYHPKIDPGYDQVGIASWYGPQFHGRYTANGEKFDMNKLTAAHRTLPMPSYVRVTNLQNGRSLVLRVNDRGPFAKNRIIDVSRRAAQLLGFERSGTARVRVQAVDSKADAPETLPPAVPDNSVVADRVAQTTASSNDSVAVASLPPRQRATTTAGTTGASPPGVFVQLGAFGTHRKAEQIRDRAAALGPAIVEPVKIKGQTLYRVRLGPYGSDREAEGARAEVSAQGFPNATIVND